ncbi:MAG: hypothetical protein D6693_06020 [Planctomycetota bacterium]|nr:MAG: hypothetical protein D6693_06020 [Planctomycetota bacterium]
MRTVMCAVGVVVCSLGVARGLAQPAPADAPDRARARQMIQRQIEALRSRQARLEDVMARLDAGAPLDEIRRTVTERPDVALTDEDREALLTLLAELNPELHERWRRLSEQNPAMAERLRSRILERMSRDRGLRELLRLRDEDPERFRLRLEQVKLGQRATAAARRFVDATVNNDGDADRIRAEVRDLVSRQVELRLQEQRRLYEQAEARLGEARHRLAQQEERREALVDEEVASLLRRAMQGGDDRRAPRRPGLDRPR